MTQANQSMQAPKTTSVLGKSSVSFGMVIVFAMLFVALMIAFGSTITASGIGITGLGLYLVLLASEKSLLKKKESLPQWFIVSSFAASVLTALTVSIGLSFM